MGGPRFFSLGAWMLACGLSLLAQSVFAQVVIKLATAYPDDNFHTRNLVQYAEEVRRAVDGRLLIQVHPAGSLLKPTEIFEGVRDGKAEAGEVIMSSLVNESPLFGIDSLPFIVSGYEDARRMWEVSRTGIEKALEARGLKLLYAVPWQPQNLYSRIPINSIGDFKGLSMRAYNPATVRIAELVQAKPVSIQVVDLAQAINEGRLDLMITSSGTGVETKAWTRLKNYYKVSAWIPKNIVFIRKSIFDKFDEPTRNTLISLAKKAEERGWKLSEARDREYEAQLVAHKVNVSSMDFMIRQYLDRIGENLAREWLKSAGQDELKILLQYTTDRTTRAHALKQ